MKGGVRKFGAADRRLLPEGRLAGPMPWVIAIMMFLTVLAAAAGLRLASALLADPDASVELPDWRKSRRIKDKAESRNGVQARERLPRRYG